MMAVVRDWLGGLSPSERLLIAAAGALAAVLAVTTLVITPLRSAHRDAQLSYESAARLLDEVRAGVLQASQQPRGAPGAADVRGVVTRSALARGLAIARMSPVEGGLSVRLDGADPALLYAWLAELERQHRIPVQRASIRVNDAAATVQADIVLAAGGPA